MPGGRMRGHYQGLRITSAFQPVFSIAHSRPVGYEALARAVDLAAVGPDTFTEINFV